MGPELRSWIVVARKTPAADGSRPPAIVATVIHTATKTSTAPEDSLDEAFVTRWLTEYADPRHPDQRLLLIGRQ
jgi:hypothetical protein